MHQATETLIRFRPECGLNSNRCCFYIEHRANPFRFPVHWRFATSTLFHFDKLTVVDLSHQCFLSVISPWRLVSQTQAASSIDDRIQPRPLSLPFEFLYWVRFWTHHFPDTLIGSDRPETLDSALHVHRNGWLPGGGWFADAVHTTGERRWNLDFREVEVYDPESVSDFGFGE
jgi:hypothetical protein